MEQKLMRERETKCVQEQPPGCTSQCPLHVDARGIANAVQKQDFAAGFALYQRIVPFPNILSCICEQPCQHGCKRREIDEAIDIRQLEKLCTVSSTTAPQVLLPPAKKQKAAIVGAGISGLTTAVELARKGYPVTVFEATDKLGGRLWEIPEDILPRYLLDKDFALLQKLPIRINYHSPVNTLAELCAEFDAVYVACGASFLGGDNWGLDTDSDGTIKLDPISLLTSSAKVFAGGSLRRPAPNLSYIYSLADGKIAALSIDRLFQGASLTANREKESVFETSLYTNINGVQAKKRIQAADRTGGYTSLEAVQEADRCLLCECLECVKACEYLAHYRGYPKRYVREIYNNLSIVMGIHHANKMINSCSLCGLCAEVCPGNLDMGEICLEARQSMVEKNKMPPSAHDFALRDMQFSNGELCALARHQPGYATSEWVFYPGCQLAASSPQHVEQLYGYLREKLTGGVGLMLGCCGAPATWAGQVHLFQENVHKLEAEWRKLGTPRMITACPTCYRLFKECLPDMTVESVWTLLERIGLPTNSRQVTPGQKIAIHDSCTTRYEAQLQSSVREIVNKLGYQIEELPFSREHTNCCGYGGLMLYVNKELAHKVIERRITESQSDYLTYCSMCRDNFAGQGKRTYHLLDLIFGQEQAAREVGPGYSQRQENRARLKQTLLSEVWGEEAGARQPENKLSIAPEVLKIMEDRQILVNDVSQVIDYAERSGNKLKNNVTGHYLAYYQPASVTYWVEYKPQEDGFVVCNAYSHRLVIG